MATEINMQEQKKIIIIGATSGIGKELAIIYAKKGYFVGITGRRNEMLLSLQSKFPKNIVTESFDVTQKENIPHLQALIQKLDGLDILIYNSGAGDVSKDLDWDIEKHDRPPERRLRRASCADHATIFLTDYDGG